ncbi:glycoside hydrolase family 3 protein [Mangrovihabitans endophyticus]|uniref:beta-N-acetylhexosaminidase n=1 Tax=Mangrovihabitans endophyticus TaxID=1751298 RepID=A0A8J3FRQ9_9ACTN|nr:glycoside hydrolase family 3 protein [Mangrovihabitans endophyticus]GGL13627.1 beta-glucosidase [Mangrovihabitans endophyticus]
MTNARWRPTRRLWWPLAAIVIVLAALVLHAVLPDRSTPTASPHDSSASSAPAEAPASRSAPAPSSASGTPGDAGCVAATLSGLSLAERAGQLLMIGTPVDEPGDLRESIAAQHLGGVFLAGRSTRRAASLRADIAGLQKSADVPLLVSLDQEGGSVQTLKGKDFPLLPSAQRLGDGSAAKLRDTVGDSAGRLDGIGVTMNLAPVADTVPAALGEGNPPIGDFHRQYGSDPQEVAADIRTVVAASQDEGVLTVLKHFPGLGRVRANTDTSTRAVDSKTTADDPYLEPFRAGIEAGSAAVMVSSARYPKLDDENIAAYSRPIVTGLLRDRLGFDGLVMSDDLGAADAAATMPPGERAVRFVSAGGDLALSIRGSDAEPMATALVTEAKTSDEFATRVDEAARHVLAAKQRAGVLSCAP